MTPPQKQPTIRPGQHVPYHKGTQEQIDQRIGCVARMLDAGATKTEIHRAVRERFNVKWRQCDRYISWLARRRGEYTQIPISEVLANLKFIYGDNVK